MKTYDQLTPDQQILAVEHALKEIRSNVARGLISYQPLPSRKILLPQAQAAAEAALYAEEGEYVVYDIANKKIVNV